jgi:hypothetical protein
MKLEHIRIDEIDGWHDDGWCSQLVRARAVAGRDAAVLNAEIWFPRLPEGDESSIVTLAVGNDSPSLFTVRAETPTVISTTVAAELGKDLTFRIFCNNRIPQSGEDQRQLSFVLMGMALA